MVARKLPILVGRYLLEVLGSSPRMVAIFFVSSASHLLFLVRRESCQLCWAPETPQMQNKIYIHDVAGKLSGNGESDGCGA